MSEGGAAGDPPRPRVSDALDRVNDGFHDAYDRVRMQAERDAPLFVVLADVLVVVRHGQRQERPFTPALFHVIKSVAHAPVAVFAALESQRGAPLDDEARRRLAAIRENVASSMRTLSTADDWEATAGFSGAAEDMRELLSHTSAYLARLDEGGAAEASLDAFAKATGPRLLRLTVHATRVQLDALDACVERALGELDDDERQELRVVVTGDHQARVRSLGMQYFGARLARDEDGTERVTYGEGVTDVDGALALIGRQRLDVVIAKAFFGDASRLQRDVLGDAVHEQLASRTLPRIG